MADILTRSDTISNKMKEYIDPIAGTVSYSGADYTAVVFLPVSEEKLRQELTVLNTRIDEIKTDVREFGNVWNDLSQKYAAALQAGDTQSQLIFGKMISNLNLAGNKAAQRELIILLEQKKQLEQFASYDNKAGRKFVRPIVLGDVQTISISTHREKFPVRTCGRVLPKSHTRGGRTLAGSMIFTVLNRHALWDLVQAGLQFYSTGVGQAGSDSGWPEISTVMVDQLPPFDLTLIASNEVGDSSYAVIYGVEIVNEGQTMSVQDLITESVMQFYCRDFDPLRPLDEKRAVMEKGREVYHSKTADEILSESKKRRKGRMNPFV